ncbi:NfeD family protein [Homoserinibacter sp. YIM 151385]|uniref:NfeD family protein n=1 Tax=Homoserinibacter sp. YIM 151385 TaxID=2985506 RepID=UPI0022F01782|nr:NfeD family protein [Homoserinibacter sp. YIM 151385]WBU38542.1 NfeD family protein [Homoserinibacter sp. YIM 151385]
MFPDLTQYLWIVWLVFVVLFVIVELVTLEFTFLMLAAGSLVGGLGMNLIGAPWWAQIGTAAVVSALLLFTIRPLLLRTLKKGADPTPSNVDALHGLGGRVTVAFADGAGTVKLDNGETWTARRSPAGATDIPLDQGARIVVTRIHGATAEVAPAPTASPTAERSEDA